MNTVKIAMIAASLALFSASAQAQTGTPIKLAHSGKPFEWPTSAKPDGAASAAREPANSSTSSPVIPPVTSPATLHEATAHESIRHATNPRVTIPADSGAHRRPRIRPTAPLLGHAVSKIEPTVKVTRSSTTERIIISTDRLFDPDQATIMPGGEAALSNIIQYLSRWSEHPVTIECHTDNFGFDSYIRKLSQLRAERLRTWFVQKGLMEDAQVTAIGVGKDHPIAPNRKADGTDDLQGMAVNRRVEITVDKTRAIEVAVLDPIHESSESNPAGEKEDWSTGTEDKTAAKEASAQYEPNPIIDALPRQEEAQKPRGTQDSTSQAEPAKPPDPEVAKQHAWEQKEFGLWREEF